MLFNLLKTTIKMINLQLFLAQNTASEIGRRFLDHLLPTSPAATGLVLANTVSSRATRTACGVTAEAKHVASSAPYPSNTKATPSGGWCAGGATGTTIGGGALGSREGGFGHLALQLLLALNLLRVGQGAGHWHPVLVQVRESL